MNVKGNVPKPPSPLAEVKRRGVHDADRMRIKLIIMGGPMAVVTAPCQKPTINGFVTSIDGCPRANDGEDRRRRGARKDVGDVRARSSEEEHRI